MGYRATVGVRPLARARNRDPAGIVDVGEAGLWLQVRVFLGRCAVFGLDDNVSLLETSANISFADLVADADIGAAYLGVDQASLGPKPFQRVAYDRQVLILHSNQSQSCLRCRLSFCNDDRNLIPNEANGIGVRSRGTGATEDRLIRYLEAVFVHGYVSRRVHRPHPVGSHCIPRLYGFYNGVRPFRKKDLHEQHSWHGEIARILGFACDFAVRIRPGNAVAYC
jgi:hypothetical protein